MDDKTLEMTMLLDFYGEMLTDKQREYLDLYYNQDLSLSEIAEIGGISRQGVRDLLVRAESYLFRLEEKLGMMRRYLNRRKAADRIRELLSELNGIQQNERGRELAAEIRALLQDMEN